MVCFFFPSATEVVSTGHALLRFGAGCSPVFARPTFFRFCFDEGIWLVFTRAGVTGAAAPLASPGSLCVPPPRPPLSPHDASLLAALHIVGLSLRPFDSLLSLLRRVRLLVLLRRLGLRRLRRRRLRLRRLGLL